jgi:two-component system, cell cycle response regulator DivK
MARILLIEDNDLNRDIISRHLAHYKHQVLLAANGLQGIALARAELPDLIIMDMSLPLLDGWEATRQLKAIPETSSIPVIALTAHAMADDRQRSFEVGCSDYETKPIDFPKLLKKIEVLLETRNTR